MGVRSKIALVALTTALISPQLAMAAKRGHHTPAKTSDGILTVAEQLRDAQQQIAQLQAQLNSIQSKIDQQTNPQVQAQVAQASADAQAASAKADQALATATATSAAEAKTDKTVGLMKWAADTKISGRMYFNSSYVSHYVNGTKVGNTDNGVGFNIKRFYVGIDHKFNDVFSANITTDVSAISGVGQSLYIKKAYLQAKVSPALVVSLGANDLPWIPYVENVYGYRHIEQTLIDRTKFGTSSDWGVHVKGDLVGGIVSYDVAAVTGAGYRDVHFSKTVDFEGRLSAKYKGFNVAVGGYVGKLGKNLYGVSFSPAPLQTYHRFDALAAYGGEINKMPVTLGFEYFWANHKAFNSTAPLPVTSPSDASEGYSAFASVTPIKKWSVFGKYEHVTPTEDGDPFLKEDYFNVGLQWSPVKIVDLALVYKRDVANNGAYATGNLQSGVIGCSLSASLTCLGHGTYDEIGLFGQLRW